MTPRAPVALRCSRRGDKFVFVTRRPVRLNPIPQPKAAIERAKEAAEAAAKQGVAPNQQTVEAIAVMLGNEYERRLRSEDIGANVMMRVLAEAKKYDPKRGSGFLSYARYHADMAAKGSITDSDDRGRIEAKAKMKGWLKAFEKQQGRKPESKQELADFLTQLTGRRHTLEEIIEISDAARRGAAISMDASTSGDDGEEDGQTVGETITASTSHDENETAIVQAQAAAAVRAATAELNAMERKFVEQHNRGLSVTDIAKRMGISRSSATSLKRAVMAHLTRPDAD